MSEHPRRRGSPQVEAGVVDQCLELAHRRGVRPRLRQSLFPNAKIRDAAGEGPAVLIKAQAHPEAERAGRDRTFHLRRVHCDPVLVGHEGRGLLPAFQRGAQGFEQDAIEVEAHLVATLDHRQMLPAFGRQVDRLGGEPAARSDAVAKSEAVRVCPVLLHDHADPAGHVVSKNVGVLNLRCGGFHLALDRELRPEVGQRRARIDEGPAPVKIRARPDIAGREPHRPVNLPVVAAARGVRRLVLE